MDLTGISTSNFIIARDIFQESLYVNNEVRLVMVCNLFLAIAMFAMYYQRGNWKCEFLKFYHCYLIFLIGISNTAAGMSLLWHFFEFPLLDLIYFVANAFIFLSLLVCYCKIQHLLR